MNSALNPLYIAMCNSLLVENYSKLEQTVCAKNSCMQEAWTNTCAISAGFVVTKDVFRYRLSKDALLAEQRGNVNTNFENIYGGGSDMDRHVICATQSDMQLCLGRRLRGFDRHGMNVFSSPRVLQSQHFLCWLQQPKSSKPAPGLEATYV